MKILSIGNSFSQDAHKWLPQIAKSCNDDIEVVNLYIGGCSLQTHWEKYIKNDPAYDLEINSQFVRKISISEALKLNDWDVVTFQQASHLSSRYDTYQPFLDNLFNEVKKMCGDAKIYIHQTWSYEIDHRSFLNGNYSQKEMYRDLKVSYNSAAAAINAHIIPVGNIIQHLRDTVPEFDYKNGGLSFNSDGMHLSQTYGRYVAALVWYGVLFAKDVRKVNFIPPGADIKLISVIKNSVFEALKK